MRTAVSDVNVLFQFSEHTRHLRGSCSSHRKGKFNHRSTRINTELGLSGASKGRIFAPIRVFAGSSNNSTSISVAGRSGRVA
jgi:hypothetical protein